MPTDRETELSEDQARRRHWMGILARADGTDVVERVAALGGLPDVAPLRGPEIGSVMVRGRAGGTGDAFNLGEMTVTRCSLRLPTGEVGHAMVQGRNKTHAREAALADALLQGPRAVEVMTRVIAPLKAGLEARAAQRAARAEETKVSFFTLARGEVD